MLLRAVFAALALALASVAAPASAQVELNIGRCMFNEDKSALLVVAGNGGDEPYACGASCKYIVTGQRPLQTFTCGYDLLPNSPDRAVCTLEGDGPNYFSEIRSPRIGCAPFSSLD